jgi:protein involved in polysaccharide export with SLBB domain
MQKLNWLALLTISLVSFAAMPPPASADGASSAAASPAAATGTTAPSNGIAPIGPSDPLNVSVIGEPDLTNTYVVDAEGNIEMPYVGKIHVSGLTPDQAQALIQKKLSDIYTDPQVSVVRTGMGGISITVIGAVVRQGNSSLRRDAHLNDAIQLSTPTPDADLKHINITHGLPGQRHTTDTFDLDAFLTDGNLSDNPSLQDGDTIFIPKSTQSIHSVSVTGEVVKPGRYQVAAGATAFDLITLAGGLSPNADPSATYVQAMGSTVQSPFNYTTAAQNPSNYQLDPVLQDGDQIVVPLITSLPTYAVTGAVLKPGEYPLKGVVTLLDAITVAGGLEPRAKAKDTKITRTTPKGPIVIVVNASDTKAAATTYLQPGDNIIVPHGSTSSGFNPLNILGTVASIFSIFKL